MGKYTGKILLSDLDGTLFDSDTNVSAGNKEAIAEFVKEGGKFGIATGRSMPNAAKFLEGIAINSYCILANGGLLYDYEGQQYVEEYDLPKEKVEPFLKRCIAKQPQIGVQIYARDMCYFVSAGESVWQEVIANHQPIRVCSMEQVRNQEWVKILFYGKEEDLEWIMEQSEYLELERAIARVRSSDIFYEFLPAQINKGTMLAKLRKYVPETDTIYAVGDFYNDMDMLKASDVGIAMGNAPQEVKEVADHVCADCNHSAIADVIQNII